TIAGPRQAGTNMGGGLQVTARLFPPCHLPSFAGVCVRSAPQMLHPQRRPRPRFALDPCVQILDPSRARAGFVGGSYFCTPRGSDRTRTRAAKGTLLADELVGGPAPWPAAAVPLDSRSAGRGCCV